MAESLPNSHLGIFMPSSIFLGIHVKKKFSVHPFPRSWQNEKGKF